VKVFKTALITGILLLMNVSLAFGGVNVNIDIRATKVANLLYTIQKDGVSCIEDGSIFYLIDANGSTVGKVESKDSSIAFENIPFGEYTLEYDGILNYKIVVDEDYLDSQHIYKIINIITEKEKSDYLNNLPITGVESKRLNIAFILIVVGITLFRKRKEVV